MLDAPKSALPQLPPRLRALAHEVIEGAPVADIGTDHGLLPIYLVRAGLAPSVVASDKAKAPLARAKEKTKIWRELDRVSLRLGDGLTPLKPEDKIATLVIAGMGGKRIARILKPPSLSPLTHLRRLVLQANRDHSDLKIHLESIGWSLIKEIQGPEERWRWSVQIFERQAPPGPMLVN